MNILKTIGAEKLTSNTSLSQFDDTYELLKDFIKSNLKHGAIWTICKAYRIGVMQGKHEQRQITRKQADI